MQTQSPSSSPSALNPAMSFRTAVRAVQVVRKRDGMFASMRTCSIWRNASCSCLLKNAYGLIGLSIIVAKDVAEEIRLRDLGMSTSNFSMESY